MDMRFLATEKISSHKYKTPEGYLVCTDAILARTGKQDYKRSELFGDSADGGDEIVGVDRSPDEVFDPRTIASFENKPITDEHPDVDVNPANYRDYAVGFVRDVRRSTADGQDVIIGNLVFTDEEAIRKIDEGECSELSCGYECDIKDDGSGNYSQTNIRGNHVALCQAGRAGIARIVDSDMDDAVETKVGYWYGSDNPLMVAEVKNLKRNNYLEVRVKTPNEMQFQTMNWYAPHFRLKFIHMWRTYDEAMKWLWGHFNPKDEKPEMMEDASFDFKKAIDIIKKHVKWVNGATSKDNIVDALVAYGDFDRKDAKDFVNRQGLKNIRELTQDSVEDAPENPFKGWAINGDLKTYNIDSLIGNFKRRQWNTHTNLLNASKTKVYTVIIGPGLHPDFNTGKNMYMDVVWEDVNGHQERILMKDFNSWDEARKIFEEFRRGVRDSVNVDDAEVCDSTLVDIIKAVKMAKAVDEKDRVFGGEPTVETKTIMVWDDAKFIAYFKDVVNKYIRSKSNGSEQIQMLKKLSDVIDDLADNYKHDISANSKYYEKAKLVNKNDPFKVIADHYRNEYQSSFFSLKGDKDVLTLNTYKRLPPFLKVV